MWDRRFNFLCIFVLLQAAQLDWLVRGRPMTTRIILNSILRKLELLSFKIFQECVIWIQVTHHTQCYKLLTSEVKLLIYFSTVDLSWVMGLLFFSFCKYDFHGVASICVSVFSLVKCSSPKANSYIRIKIQRLCTQTKVIFFILLMLWCRAVGILLQN